MMKNHSFIKVSVVLFPLIIGSIVVVTLFLRGNLVFANVLKPTPTIEDPVSRALAAQINNYDDQLKNKSLDTDSQKKLKVERRFYEQQATQRADLLQTPEESLYSAKQTVVAKDSLTPQPTYSKPNVKMGMQDQAYFPYVQDADLSTAWAEPSGDDYVLYFSGKLKTDPGQGVIYIFDVGKMKVKKYLAPGKDGDLKITGFDKNKLFLISQNGKKEYFDTNALNFSVDNGSLVDVTPTPQAAYPAP